MKLDGLPVWSGARSSGPLRLAVEELAGRDQPLLGDQPLQRGEPVMVIGVTAVWIARGLSLLNLLREPLRPFRPREVPRFVEPDGHREGLGLPGLREDRRARLVPGQRREIRRTI